MPVLSSSSYRAPWLLRNGHTSTIFTALFRQAAPAHYQRFTLATPDDDFLDVDVLHPTVPSNRAVLLLHGLEGSSQGHYLRSMANAVVAAGWSAVALNFRGCSGRPNRFARSYHSGVTEDVQVAVEWVQQKFPQSKIALIGFSLGGNVLLKYLGEGSRHASVVGGVAVSVPVDLAGSATVLASPINRIYMRRFMRDMTRKLELKNQTIGTDFDIPSFRRMRTFAEFDGAYTAPVHGFASAEDYWQRNSSLPLLQHIDVPTLLVNALDDPFLSASCLPEHIASASDAFFLETPRHGGHVGFLSDLHPRQHCWHEARAVQFLHEYVFP